MQHLHAAADALAFLLAALPVVFTSTEAQGADDGARSGIARSLQPFIDSHTLAGAVTLVASKDAVLSLEAVGFADIATARPMRTDDVFWIASQTKPITGTALMMLVDEGRVRVDEPVERYLPEFRGQMVVVERDGEHVLLRKPVHPITVRNVLTHTSGLPFSSPMERPTLDGLPLRDAVRSYAMLPLEFEPDSRYQYSNAGVNTAGRIIEVVSGMPYETFLQKRLFDPLGMKDTTFWPNEEQVRRLAVSYRPNAAKDGLEATKIGQLRYPLSDRKSRYPMPAGGLFSTASDVARFCQMVLNGGVLDGRRYVSEAAVRQMTSKQTPAGVKDGYGFGWAAGDGWFGHGGAHSTNMTVNAKLGLVAVFMVQHAGFPGQDGGKIHPTFMKAAVDGFKK